MNMRLTGKVAVVSGGGSIGNSLSIGRATSILLARAGAQVLVADKNLKAAEETVAQIKSEKGKAIAISVDALKNEDIDKMVSKAISKCGKIDILFNNVGFGWGADIVSTSEEQWNDTIAICLNSVYKVSRKVIPEMRKAGGGVIVNNASVAGLRSLQMKAYGAAKAGVIRLTKDMACDYGRENIRVNCVVPGFIDTALFKFLLNRTPNGDTKKKMQQGLLKMIPLGRFGSPWDVGNAVLFLASDEASYCNGTSIIVDGGFCAT